MSSIDSKTILLVNSPSGLILSKLHPLAPLNGAFGGNIFSLSLDTFMPEYVQRDVKETPATYFKGTCWKQKRERKRNKYQQHRTKYYFFLWKLLSSDFLFLPASKISFRNVSL